MKTIIAAAANPAPIKSGACGLRSSHMSAWFHATAMARMSLYGMKAWQKAIRTRIGGFYAY